MSRLKRCGLMYLSDKSTLQGLLHQVHAEAVYEDLSKRDIMLKDRIRATLAWDTTFTSISGGK